MGQDKSRRGTVDGDRDAVRFAGAAGMLTELDEAIRRVIVYLEGQPPEGQFADWRIGFFVQDLEAGIAQCRQVEGLVVWHGSVPFRVIHSVSSFRYQTFRIKLSVSR